MPWQPVVGRTRFAMCCTATAQSGVGPRGLPDDRVAAHGRERGVPRPDGDREVERGDDARRRRAGATAPSSGAPGARRPSSGRRAGARGRPRSRRCRSSPALRRGPRRDLPHLQADEVAQRLLHLAQRVAEVAHDLAPLGRGHHPPRQKAATASATTDRRPPGGLHHARDRFPVVGLCETSMGPSGSLIQPSGPKQAPGLTSLIWSSSSRAAVVVSHGMARGLLAGSSEAARRAPGDEGARPDSRATRTEAR